MRKLMLIAGAALMVTAAPALAQKGNGHGNGNGNGNGHGGGMPEIFGDHGDGIGRGDHEHGSMRAEHAMRHGDDRVVRTSRVRYGGRSCPPGLAKKSPACVPPGQARRLFSQGQRVPAGYRYYSSYNSIPQQYRSEVPYDAANRYIYRDNQVYVVNPQTRLITQIINLLR